MHALLRHMAVPLGAWLLFAAAVFPSWLPFNIRLAFFLFGTAALLATALTRRTLACYALSALALAAAFVVPLPLLATAPALVRLGITVAAVSLLPLLAAAAILRFAGPATAVPPQR